MVFSSRLYGFPYMLVSVASGTAACGRAVTVWYRPDGAGNPTDHLLAVANVTELLVTSARHVVHYPSYATR